MEPSDTFPSKEWSLELYETFRCLLNPELKIFDDSIVHLLQDKIKGLGLYEYTGEKIAYVISFRGSEIVRTLDV